MPDVPAHITGTVWKIEKKVGEEVKELSSSSKFAIERSFFLLLRDIGRNAADEFLKEHFASIGKRATFDLKQEAA